MKTFTSRKLSAVIGAVVATGLLLTGCTGGGNASSETQATSSPKASASPTSEPNSAARADSCAQMQTALQGLQEEISPPNTDPTNDPAGTAEVMAASAQKLAGVVEGLDDTEVKAASSATVDSVNGAVASLQAFVDSPDATTGGAMQSAFGAIPESAKKIAELCGPAN